MDFKKIEDGDQFEEFCTDVLKSMDNTRIITPPSRGADFGKDIIIEATSMNAFGEKKIQKYVVQCKHYATSGKSVTPNDLGDIRSTCSHYDTKCYMLITSTMISTNTEKIFDALKKEGYDVVYWGGSQLIDQVNELSNGQDIIKKYNLLEFVDNCFIYMQNVLMHEKNLPFKFFSEESTNDMKGIVFKQQTLDKQKDEYVDEFIGYLCADKLIDEKTYLDIYKKFGLSKLTIITPDEKQTDFTSKMSEFYESIQLYKDYWYQEALAFTANYTSINPGIIRLLQVTFNNSPYKPQYPLVELLKNFLERIDYNRKSLLNTITLAEVCKVIEKHRIYELQDLVFEHLKAIPKKSKEIIVPVDDLAVFKQYGTGAAVASAVLQEGEAHIETFTKHLVQTLIALERRDAELKQEMLDLFNSENDVKFRIRLLPFFSRFNMIDSIEDKLIEMKNKYGQVKGRTNNAIDYRDLNKPVDLVINLVHFTVEEEIDKVLINSPRQEDNK